MVGPSTWRFHLRPAVTFHDGRPFGSDDVVWSWAREFLPRSVSGTLEKVVKVDDLTVDFVSTSPNLRLPVDGYWGAKARAERLTFRFMPDPQVRLEALRSGDFDMVTGLPRESQHR